MKETERILKFAIVGLLGVIINIATFNVQYYLLELKEFSEVTSYIIAFICNAYLNRKYTFDVQSEPDHFSIYIMKYASCVAFPTFLIYFLVFNLLSSHLSPNLSLCSAIFINFIFSFLLSKVFFER